MSRILARLALLGGVVWSVCSIWGCTPQLQGALEPDDAPTSSERPDHRRIAEEVNLELRVDHAGDTFEAIEQRIGRHDGRLVERTRHHITLRVPTDELDSMLDSLQTIESVDEVISKTLETRDVTAQLTDLEDRLDNKRETREHYRKIWQQAEKVEDKLTVESEIENITDEIDRLERQLETMHQRVVLSTIHVHLQGGGDQKRHQGGGADVTGFSPSLTYSRWWLGGDGTTRRFQGPHLDIALLAWRGLYQQSGPSHGALSVDLGFLLPIDGGDTLWGYWSLGLQLAFETHPQRRWLIPTFGLETGQLITPDQTYGHLTPSTGLLVWSGERAIASVEGSYLVPPRAFAKLRGWRVDIGVRFTLW